MINRARPITVAALLALGLLACGEAGAFAQEKPVPAAETPKADDGTDPAVARETKHYNAKTGKPAIDGYDPVAYFPEGGGAAKKGDKQHAFTYRGVLYHFASAANLEAFKKNPRKFEPAYGGWCAFAMGKTGDKVEIDPKSFRIHDGRLFLFYTDFFTDTREKWTKDEANLNPKADANWKKTSGEEAPKQNTPAAPASPPAPAPTPAPTPAPATPEKK